MISNLIKHLSQWECALNSGILQRQWKDIYKGREEEGVVSSGSEEKVWTYSSFYFITGHNTETQESGQDTAIEIRNEETNLKGKPRAVWKHWEGLGSLVKRWNERGLRHIISCHCSPRRRAVEQQEVQYNFEKKQQLRVTVMKCEKNLGNHTIFILIYS